MNKFSFTTMNYRKRLFELFQTLTKTVHINIVLLLDANTTGAKIKGEYEVK